jgi:predicted neuraminidase
MDTIANPALAPVVVTLPEEKHQTQARQFQGIPGIERTPTGRLWATWYSGGVHEGPNNFVVLVTSTDEGESWTEPVAVVEPGTHVRAYDPVVWIDPEERLWLFCAQCYTEKDGTISDAVAGVWGAWTRDIESDNPSWSDPIRIANGVMMNKPTVLANGDWALPTAIWKESVGGLSPEPLRGEQFSNMTLSTDGGKTFTLQGGSDIPTRHFDEHMIVEKKDGTLWMQVRTTDGIGQSFSEDGGKTWSEGDPLLQSGPNSRFYIRRLKSGNLVLVNHDMERIKEGENRRKMLTAWLSDDDGASWKGGLLLDERISVSYPDGCEDEDGNITIIYDHERYAHGDIVLARFTEAEILAGAISRETSFLKRLVNATGGVPGWTRG